MEIVFESPFFKKSNELNRDHKTTVVSRLLFIERQLLLASDFLIGQYAKSLHMGIHNRVSKETLTRRTDLHILLSGTPAESPYNERVRLVNSIDSIRAQACHMGADLDEFPPGASSSFIGIYTALAGAFMKSQQGLLGVIVSELIMAKVLKVKYELLVDLNFSLATSDLRLIKADFIESRRKDLNKVGELAIAKMDEDNWMNDFASEWREFLDILVKEPSGIVS